MKLARFPWNECTVLRYFSIFVPSQKEPGCDFYLDTMNMGLATSLVNYYQANQRFSLTDYNGCKKKNVAAIPCDALEGRIM